MTGGKWTTYRKMAEDVVDTAIQRGLVARAAPCITTELALHGAQGLPADLPASGSGSPDRYYGNNWEPCAHCTAGRGADGGLRLTAAHVRFAARHEMARRVEDVLARRNRALFLDARGASAAAPRVAAHRPRNCSTMLQQTREVEDFRKLASGYMLD